MGPPRLSKALQVMIRITSTMGRYWRIWSRRVISSFLKHRILGANWEEAIAGFLNGILLAFLTR